MIYYVASQGAELCIVHAADIYSVMIKEQIATVLTAYTLYRVTRIDRLMLIIVL